jgi:DNA-binding LacI/PurR family transcriptional regulator
MSILLGQDDVDDFIATEMYTVEGGQAAASRLLEHGCTAIVCASDLMALGAVRGVRAVGMRVPDDISVIGYDDSTLIAFTDPPLTTVRQRVLAMGETTVQALVDEIAGIPASRTEYVFRPELVVRGSTGACRFR